MNLARAGLIQLYRLRRKLIQSADQMSLRCQPDLMIEEDLNRVDGNRQHLIVLVASESHYDVLRVPDEAFLSRLIHALS
jgi:hypothetical protein